MLWPMLGRFDLDMDPLTEMTRLRREVNRLFADAGTPVAGFPALNMWSNKDEAIVVAEIPGVDPSGINVDVAGNVLTIEGKRDPEPTGEDDIVHRAERIVGDFFRSIRLPFDVEADNVKASCSRGLLRLTLPRKEASKPRKINVHIENK